MLTTKFVTGDKYMARNQLCTATLVMLNQLCTWTAKTHAIPSLHRDSFLAKVPGLCPDAASGNAYLLYCRAVRFHSSYLPKNIWNSFCKEMFNINPYNHNKLDLKIF
jgi:hypothetical protein